MRERPPTDITQRITPVLHHLTRLTHTHTRTHTGSNLLLPRSTAHTYTTHHTSTSPRIVPEGWTFAEIVDGPSCLLSGLFLGLFLSVWLFGGGTFLWACVLTSVTDNIHTTYKHTSYIESRLDHARVRTRSETPRHDEHHASITVVVAACTVLPRNVHVLSLEAVY